MNTLHTLFMMSSIILAAFLTIPSSDVNVNSSTSSKIHITTHVPFSFTILAGPVAYASNDTNTQKMTKEELNKKLEIAREQISNLMINNTTDIPFNMVGIDEINSTLNVGIDSTKATLSVDQYQEKLKEIFGDIPIKITLGQIQLLGKNTSESSGSFSIASPLKQFKSGIPAVDIKCEQGLQIVVKIKDGSPACVKPNTSKILIERGWAKAA